MRQQERIEIGKRLDQELPILGQGQPHVGGVPAKGGGLDPSGIATGAARKERVGIGGGPVRSIRVRLKVADDGLEPIIIR